METTRALTKTGGITETGLKWIALVTMVMDHIHYFFGFTGMIPEWFSMVGRLGAPLFLFCLVEGFTHTHSRKKYFAKVYILSAAMSALLFFMAFGGILVRPDGFYPGNGMMTTFAVLMVIWQGIDWLGQKKILPGLAAVILPLAWPILASQLSVALSRSGHAAGLCRLLGPARMGHHRGQQLAGAGDGAGALPVYASAGVCRWRPSPSTTSSMAWSIWPPWPPPWPRTSSGGSSLPSTMRSTASWRRP